MRSLSFSAEVFPVYRSVRAAAGSCSISLRKNDFEVYNDFNPNLANLFRCVRDHPEELIARLEFTLTPVKILSTSATN
jgi:DNA adenine methylase